MVINDLTTINNVIDSETEGKHLKGNTKNKEDKEKENTEIKVSEVLEGLVELKLSARAVRNSLEEYELGSSFCSYNYNERDGSLYNVEGVYDKEYYEEFIKGELSINDLKHEYVIKRTKGNTILVKLVEILKRKNKNKTLRDKELENKESESKTIIRMLYVMEIFINYIEHQFKEVIRVNNNKGGEDITEEVMLLIKLLNLADEVVESFKLRYDVTIKEMRADIQSDAYKDDEFRLLHAEENMNYVLNRSLDKLKRIIDND